MLDASYLKQAQFMNWLVSVAIQQYVHVSEAPV